MLTWPWHARPWRCSTSTGWGLTTSTGVCSTRSSTSSTAGPVGLDTLAASISEESDTIMDVVEPYLLQMGFLDRTPRGRVATRTAYAHLGAPYPDRPDQPGLFA